LIEVPAETVVSSHRRHGRMMPENRRRMARDLNPDFNEYYLAENGGIEVRHFKLFVKHLF
jgi:hypothetical protein